MEGYVYILEVADIVLPVCKIGMTERNPHRRCAEINQSSTGDFLWEVAHYLYVNDCRAFESMVHMKLGPLRQKRREFFNISADDALTAVVSILGSQDEIKRMEPAISDPVERPESRPKHRTRAKAGFRQIDKDYAELMQLFTSILDVKGRPFGQLNRHVFGISDGQNGVQWNLAIYPRTSEIRIGVNLEGSEKTGRWLIANFLTSRPDIAAVSSRAKNPNDIFVSFSRDAWQGPARLDIKEKYIGGKVFVLSELTGSIWKSIVDEALTCLDKDRDYRGRKRNQIVTLVSDGRQIERDVSPHLTIWKRLVLNGDAERSLGSAIAEMTPLHDWVVAACQTD